MPISIKYRLLSKTLGAWGSPGIDPRGLKFLGGHRVVYLQKICVNEGDCSIFTETGPTLLKTLPKHVTFVIDVSGSMQGDKLKQTKDAMAMVFF